MIAATLSRALELASSCTPGCSDKEAVYRSGKLSLYRYRPIAAAGPPAARTPPLLIVYALVNRPYMMDLEADRSLIRGLLREGQEVYLIDWGYPDGADRFMTLADYIDRLLAGCTRHILEKHGVDALNMLGVCQGGVFSLCYAARHPRHVRNLITMVTPVDFHTPTDLLSRWVRQIDVAAWVGDGNLAGETLTRLFVSLMPFRLGHQKYTDLAMGDWNQARVDTFVRVERWIRDSPDQAGTAFREFATWFYQENRLATGSLEISGGRVDLRRLRVPVLNLIGTQDHIVPRDASLALGSLIGSKDYTALEFDVGHVGMYISERAQSVVPPAIARWLEKR